MRTLQTLLLTIVLSLAGSTLSAQLTPDQRAQLKKGFGLSDREIDQAIQQGKMPNISSKTPNSGGPATGTPVIVNVEPLNEQKNEGPQDAKPATEIPRMEVPKDVLKKRKANLPEARIYGQQFFRQAFDAFIDDINTRATDNYVLGVGDELSVTIWGDADYSGRFAINEAGYIDFSDNLAKLPRIFLKGITYGNAKKIIRTHISKYINLGNSQMDIALNYARTITVNVTGEVFAPNSYTILALNTAFNALVASDGPTDNGSVRNIQIISAGKPPRNFDLYKFLARPEAAEDIFLNNNDYIYVPVAERVVGISGGVKRNGAYELVKGEHLNALIAYTGGLRADAYKKSIRLTRFINNQQILIDLNLDSLERAKADFPLADGDKIEIRVVAENFENFITVRGAIKHPGSYEWYPGLRIAEILEKAEVRKESYLSRVYVSRKRPEDSYRQHIHLNLDSLAVDPTQNIALLPQDEIRVYSREKFLTDLDVQVYGEVREPGIYDYTPGMTLQDLLFFAGGLKPEAENSRIELVRISNSAGNYQPTITTLSISDTLSYRGQEIELQPYDQVFVRRKAGIEYQNNITLAGAVRYPGVYTLSSRKERLLSILKRAGGLEEDAFLDGATLVRREDNIGQLTLDLKYLYYSLDPTAANRKKLGVTRKELRRYQRSAPNFNYVLRPGDVISIPDLRREGIVTIRGAHNYKELRPNYEDNIVNVPYHRGRTAKFYVQQYVGGVNSDMRGSYSRLYVEYPNGLVAKTKNYLFWRTYPEVLQGSTITVGVHTKKRDKKSKEKDPNQTKEKIDWQQVAKDALAQASAVMTVLLLIRASSRL